MTLTYAEFCAGYGGLGLAVEDVFNAELSWYSEFEDAPSKIMAHHWPDAPNHGDMTRIDFNQVEPVDILSGGTPCQDLSHAGRRAGMRKGTRSGLWESMREAIATIQPRYVVWENVRGAYSAGADSDVEQCPGCMGEARDGEHFLRALGRVLGDLSDLGYVGQWRGLRAADVGAPHGRFRVFILAERRCTPENTDIPTRDQWGQPASRQAEGGRSWPDVGRRGGASPANPERFERERRGVTGVMGSTASSREADRQQRERVRETAGNSCPRTGTDWGPYAPAIRRWEQLRGTAPAPTELTVKGKHRLSARFCEWLMGLPAGWVTDIDISRNEQLKALGNGVVWQQAAAALDHMLATNITETGVAA